MNKKEFLNYLEKRLAVLNVKEREDIINEYAQHIEMKMLSGLSETEAVRDFGDVSELADEILSAYNVDPNYKKGGIDTEKVEETISRGASFLKRIYEKVGKFVTANAKDFKLGSFGDIVKFLFKAVIKIALLLIALCIGGSIMYSICDGILYNLLPSFWGIDEIVPPIVLFIYGIFAVIVFVCAILNIFKSAKVKNFNKVQSDKNEGIVNEGIVMEEKEVKINNNNNYNYGVKLVLWIIRIWVFFCVLPCFLFLPLSIIAFGVFVVLIFMGYPVIGLTICCLGINLFSLALLGIILKIVYFTKYGEVRKNEA